VVLAGEPVVGAEGDLVEEAGRVGWLDWPSGAGAGVKALRLGPASEADQPVLASLTKRSASLTNPSGASLINTVR